MVIEGIKNESEIIVPLWLRIAPYLTLICLLLAYVTPYGTMSKISSLVPVRVYCPAERVRVCGSAGVASQCSTVVPSAVTVRVCGTETVTRKDLSSVSHIEGNAHKQKTP